MFGAFIQKRPITGKKIFFSICFFFISINELYALDDEDIYRRNLSLYSGEVNIVGDWNFNDEETQNPYPKLTMNLMGTFSVLDIKSHSEAPQPQYALGIDHEVPPPSRPLHYPVGIKNGNTLVGFRVLPVSNRKVTAEGEVSRYYPKSEITTDNQKIIGALSLDHRLAQTYYGKTYEELKIPSPHSSNAELQSISKLFESTADKETNENLKVQELVHKNYPVVGILAYYHPQYWRASLLEMGQAGRYETQGGFGHMAAYLGQGLERDAPESLYASRGGMGIKGEPANLYSIRLKKPQGNQFENPIAVNSNARATIELLNRGVSFSEDYTRDIMKNVTLRSVLAFWRGWIDETWVFEDALSANEKVIWQKLIEKGKVKFGRVPANLLQQGADAATYKSLTLFSKIQNDPEWFLYCAEFTTLAFNISNNLLHNEKSYIQAYSTTPGEGESVFNLFKEQYKKRLGQIAPLINDDAYTPLYASEKSIMKENGIAIIDRQASRTEGLALIWKPQKTIDILASFISSYLPWTRFGSSTASFMSLNFSSQAMDRMGITFNDFQRVTLPILASMIANELGKNKKEIYANHFRGEAPTFDQIEAWKKDVETYIEGTEEAPGLRPQILSFSETINSTLEDHLKVSKEEWNKAFDKFKSDMLTLEATGPHRASSLQQAQRTARYLKYQNEEKVPADYAAETFFLDDIKNEFLEARAIPVRASIESGRKENRKQFYVENYSPPAIVQRIIHGLHKANRRIILKAEGTVFDASEVIRNSSNMLTMDGEKLLQVPPLRPE